jgi:hypothetical protein
MYPTVSPWRRFGVRARIACARASSKPFSHFVAEMLVSVEKL